MLAAPLEVLSSAQLRAMTALNRVATVLKLRCHYIIGIGLCYDIGSLGISFWDDIYEQHITDGGCPCEDFPQVCPLPTPSPPPAPSPESCTSVPICDCEPVVIMNCSTVDSCPLPACQECPTIPALPACPACDCHQPQSNVENLGGAGSPTCGIMFGPPCPSEQVAISPEPPVPPNPLSDLFQPITSRVEEVGWALWAVKVTRVDFPRFTRTVENYVARWGTVIFDKVMHRMIGGGGGGMQGGRLTLSWKALFVTAVPLVGAWFFPVRGA